MVILDPSWLGTRILGPALSPENSTVPRFTSVTGCIKLTEIQRVFAGLDPISVAHLFEYFNMCLPSDEAGTVYEFPCLIKIEKLFGLWERDPNFQVYAGVRLACSGETDIFTPGLFPAIQVHARKVLCAEEEEEQEQELSLWSGGLKCRREKVEGQLQMVEAHKSMEVMVRGWEEAREQCYSLLQQLYSLTCQCVRRCNPGVTFTTHVLSARDLGEHAQPTAYSSVEMFDALRGDGMVRQFDTGNSSNIVESVEDLLCCGSPRLLVAVKAAPFVPLRAVALQNRIRLCRLIDPRDSYGRDWCLLALQLGLAEEVPLIDRAGDNGSPTDQLLLAWEKADNGGTVVDVIDALRAIGRDDAVCVLVEGISLFVSASSPVVVNVAGVAHSSCVC